MRLPGHAVLECLAAFTLCLSSLGSPAQAPSSPSQAGPIPVIKTETRLVLVDAIVTDRKGTYISDLTQQDFRVWEDDKEQTVQTLSFAKSSADVKDLPRYTVLLFDNFNVTDADQKRVREAAANFVGANASPKNYFAVIDFGRTLEVAQNFSSDAAQLKEAVLHDKFASVSTSRDAVRVANMAGMPSSFNAEGDFGVRALLLGIRNVARKLGPMPGRKSLILFSSGFAIGPRQQSELLGATDACNKANVAIYPVSLRQLTSDVTAEAYVPGRYDTTTYGPGHGQHPGPPPTQLNAAATQQILASQSPGFGAAEGERPQSASTKAATNQQVLESMALSTGGFVIANSGDLLAGIGKVAEEQHEYYVVGYRPAQSPEGTCHNLRVKVDRPGALVRARSGYCNVKAADPLAGKPVAKQLEAWAGGESQGTLAASMRAPYFYSSPNVARVELAIEIPPGAIRFTKQKGRLTASIDILGLAYKSDGTVGVRFSDTVPIELSTEKDVEEFNKNPLHYTHEFEAASGNYQLTVVLTTGKETFARMESALDIGPYDGKRIAISEIALSEDVRPAPQNADLLAGGMAEDHTPLVSHGFEFVPCGSNRLKKNGPGAFYFEIYDPQLLAPNPPQLEMQLKIIDSKTGVARVAADGAIPEIKAGNAVVPLGMKIPLDSLAPGDYRIELRAMDSAGNATPLRTLAFQVD
jgi:VWFA-related protein